MESRDIGFWVLEMQAEPYIRELNDADAGRFSFQAEDIKKADEFLRASGIDNIGLWGAHFWQYREKIGDKSWIRAVAEIVNQ